LIKCFVCLSWSFYRCGTLNIELLSEWRTDPWASKGREVLKEGDTSIGYWEKWQ
jgi:hypothetical protein